MPDPYSAFTGEEFLPAAAGTNTVSVHEGNVSVAHGVMVMASGTANLAVHIGGFAVIRDGARGNAYASSKVTAEQNGFVIAHADSSVIAKADSHVRVKVGAFVYAFAGATLYLEHGATAVCNGVVRVVNI